jgi:heme oxygenase (biliverdin-IX-beta and delta-forming)
MSERSPQAPAICDLLRTQRIAALGTLHEGEPYVSMVPFAILAQTGELIIHVSRLSSHTQDMLDSSRVSLLVVAPDSPETLAQALSRITIQGQAEQYLPSDPRQPPAREAYLARFPQAAAILELPGFSFFAIRPVSARFIGGFAQALTLEAEEFAAVLGEAA